MKKILKIQSLECESEKLEPCSFVPVDAVLSGKPTEKGALHFSGGAVSLGTWEATPYAEMLEMRGASEFATILSGALTITDNDGVRYEFGSGDSYFLMDGFVGRFEVTETMRKTYVLIEGDAPQHIEPATVA